MPHARLQPLLASRPVQVRRPATELRQAVRPRLPRGHRLEQGAARARVAARSCRAYGGEVSRGVHSPDRPRTHPRMTVLAPDVEEFLSQPNVAALSTVRPDGRPHVTPVWYEYDGKEFIIST